jgi:hypothetical protein
MTWTEALQQIPLGPGTYQGIVHGHPAELTIKSEPVSPVQEEPSEPDGPPYLLPDFETPWEPIARVTPKWRESPLLPDPFPAPEDDGAES